MTQGVEHYINTGELPSDPAILAKLYEEMVASESDTKLVEDDNLLIENEESSSAATSAASEKTVETKEPDGILTKDGKHVISYEVLKNERLQRQEAERKLAEWESNKQSNTQIDLSNLGLLTDEQLAEQKEYFPETYEAIVAQQNNLVALYKQSEQIKHAEQQRIAERQRQEQINIQELIDNNPVLSHWQQNDPDAWAYAVQQDNLLSSNPKFATLPMIDRFNKATELALQVYDSPIKSIKSTKTTPARPVINSLSDIRTGTDNVSASEKSQLEELSPGALAKMFMGKSQEQIAAIIDKLSS